jgi:hypothetical protein
MLPKHRTAALSSISEFPSFCLTESALDDGGKQARSPGSTKKTLKPLRAGTLGESGCLCSDYARVLTSHLAREAADAARIRRSPRPLFSRRKGFVQNSGVSPPRGRGVASETIWLFEN